MKAGRSEPIAVGYRPFTVREYRRRRVFLTEVALRTSKAVVIAQELAAALRADRIIVPSARVIDRCCAEALARGMRLFYQRLAEDLAAAQRQYLDRLLNMWTAPWIAIFPGLMILITLLSINFIGDGLRDGFDPHLSSR